MAKIETFTRSPYAPPQPIGDSPTSQKWKLATIALIVAISGFFAYQWWENSGSDSATIRGTVRLLGFVSDDFSLGLDGCYGSGGYDDLKPGTAVRILNDEGEIIASGKFQGVPRDEASGCEWTFEVNVPKIDSYSIETGSGRRGDFTISREDLEAQEWKLTLSVGSVGG
jgi:hypothetical protein